MNSLSINVGQVPESHPAQAGTAQPFRSIPGPSRCGAYLTIWKHLGKPLDFMGAISNQYGKMARFSLLNESILLISDAKLIEEVLVEKQSSFHKGRALEQSKAFLGNSVLVSEGAEHHRQRKLMQPAFHRARIAGYAHTMATHAEEWTQKRHAGEKLDMAAQMNQLTLEIVAATLFGSDLQGTTKEITDSLTIVMEHFQRMVMPFASLFRMLPTATNRKIRQAEANLNRAIHQIIQERRKSGEDRGDLLSMLLAAEDEQSEQKHLRDEEIRDQAMTLFIAGHETTANALSWTWHLLAQNGADEVREKMREEVLHIVGPDRLPSLDDVPKLTYTRAVLSESMRLFPPVWMIGRRSTQNVVIGNVEIPRGTLVLTSPALMHRSETYWDEPHTFNPERWLKKEIKELPKCAYFPFGAGARVCMGEAFAWTEGIILLASMARKWKFTYCGPQALPAPSITLRTKAGMPMEISAA